jgi:hypothetical protein
MRHLLLLTLAFGILQSSNAQWFDRQSLSSTVLLEKLQGGSLVPHGTGFVLWNYNDPKYAFVVTAAHLLKHSELFVSVNADSALLSYASVHNLDTLQFVRLKWSVTGQRLRAKVRLVSGPNPTFLANDSLDIGVFLIDLGTRGVTKSGDSIRIADFLMIPRSQMRLRHDVSLGDEAYFVGFPFGVGSLDRIEPIVRSGSVAWLSPSMPVFLLDAFSFGGNSGGPVFSKMIFGIRGEVIALDTAFVIGMVVGHLGEAVAGVIWQPDPKDLKFERASFEIQNYGLARCIWIDEILRIVEQAKTLRLPE